MGEAVRGWGVLPGAVVEIQDGYWTSLTGAPRPDVNIVLVQSPDPEVMAQALARVEQIGVPAIVALTDGVPQELLPDGWQPVGILPFMAADLSAVPTAEDSRVRVAGPDDLDVTVALFADAFELDPEVARVLVEPVLSGATDGVSDMRFWLLLDDGIAVSTVLDARAGDAVTVWSMSTPEKHQRRGHGRALLAHVLLAARRDGCTTGLLAASPAGKRLYDATGWHTLEDWRLFTDLGR